MEEKDCSPSNRERELGLDRRETGLFYPTMAPAIRTDWRSPRVPRPGPEARGSPRRGCLWLHDSVREELSCLAYGLCLEWERSCGQARPAGYGLNASKPETRTKAQLCGLYPALGVRPWFWKRVPEDGKKSNTARIGGCNLFLGRSAQGPWD